jgi:glycerophosphoryl diester phosphodiesterase
MAHRGFSGKYPENTMLAFEKAVFEGNCDGFETDVHMSADGALIVIHDDTLDRTTTGSGRVDAMEYSQLQKLDAGVKYDAVFAGERIPLLADVLELVKKRDLMLNIELKNMSVTSPGLETRVIELVRSMDMVEQVQLSSFNHISMVQCARIAPEIYTALLYMQPMYEAWIYALHCGAKALNPYFLLAQYEPQLAAYCADLGLDINVWTVDEPEEIAEMCKLVKRGSIISNYPDRVHAALRGSKKA